MIQSCNSCACGNYCRRHCCVEPCYCTEYTCPTGAAGATGNTGPTGAAGATGNTGATATATTLSVKTGVLSREVVVDDTYLVAFPENQIIPPTILVSADNTQFTITEAGTYMVWLKASSNGGAVRPTDFSLQVNNVVVPPSSATVVNFQDVLILSAGDVLSVLVRTQFNGTSTINNGQLIIMRLS